jgi:hypothetical protein
LGSLPTQAGSSTVTIDNNNIFTPFDPAGSVNTTINGVNGLGQIAGFFTDANGNTIGFVGTPVPEPVAPMAVALAALVGIRLRRRKSDRHPAGPNGQTAALLFRGGVSSDAQAS